MIVTKFTPLSIMCSLVVRRGWLGLLFDLFSVNKPDVLSWESSNVRLAYSDYCIVLSGRPIAAFGQVWLSKLTDAFRIAGTQRLHLAASPHYPDRPAEDSKALFRQFSKANGKGLISRIIADNLDDPAR